MQKKNYLRVKWKHIYAGDYEKAFGAMNQIDLQKLRRRQRRLFQDADLEINACDVKQLIGTGFTSQSVRKIFNSRKDLLVQEDLIDKDGIDLKLKYVEKINHPWWFYFETARGRSGLGITQEGHCI